MSQQVNELFNNTADPKIIINESLNPDLDGILLNNLHPKGSILSELKELGLAGYIDPLNANNNPIHTANSSTSSTTPVTPKVVIYQGKKISSDEIDIAFHRINHPLAYKEIVAFIRGTAAAATLEIPNHPAVIALTAVDFRRQAHLSSPPASHRQAKQRFWEYVSYELPLELVSATRADEILGDALISRKALRQNYPQYKAEMPIGVGCEVRRNDQDFVFGFLLPQGATCPSLISNKKQRTVLRFDARKVVKHTQAAVRGQDSYMLDQFNFVASGVLFGNVHYCTEFKVGKSLGMASKVVKLTGPNNAVAEHTIPEGAQFMYGKDIFQGIAFDLLRIINWIEEVDPKSAEQLLKPFMADHPADDDVEQARRHVAERLFHYSDLREITVAHRLPFKVGDETLLTSVTIDKASGLVAEQIISQLESELAKGTDLSKILARFYQGQTNKRIADIHIEHSLGERTVSVNQTLLMRAIARNNLELVKCLVESFNVDVNQIVSSDDNVGIGYYYGMTALMFACFPGFTPIVDYLLKVGANTEVKFNRFQSETRTALDFAREGGHDNIVNLLIQAGAREIDGSVPRQLTAAESTQIKKLLHILNILAKIISETQSSAACHVTYNPTLKKLRFQFNITDNKATPTSIHHAAASTIPQAFTERKLDNKDSHQLYGLAKTRPSYTLALADGEFPTLEKVIERLLARELFTLVTCYKNYRYFVANGKFHPQTGAGATDSTQLLQLTQQQLASLTIQHATATSITFKVHKDTKIKTYELAQALNDLQARYEKLTPGSTNTAIAVVNADTVTMHQNLEQLLLMMQTVKVNYQGTIVTNSRGEIAMAMRYDAWGDRSTMGYCGAGGHCGDPYAPELGAYKELAEEFCCQLKVADLSALTCIRYKDNHAVFHVAADALRFIAAPSGAAFNVDSKEFKPGTGAFYTLRQIIEFPLTLRDVPFVSVYLEWIKNEIATHLDNVIPGLCIDLPYTVITSHKYQHIVKSGEIALMLNGQVVTDDNARRSYITQLMAIAPAHLHWVVQACHNTKKSIPHTAFRGRFNAPSTLFAGQFPEVIIDTEFEESPTPTDFSI